MQNLVLDSEFIFKTSRSGGSGGQNVNKVESKVILEFDVHNSNLLSEHQREIILKKLASRITVDGVLQIMVQTDRSQLQNKQLAVKKFYELLHKCFEPEKIRKKTKPSKAAKRKRLDSKKKHSETKRMRKRPDNS